MMRKLYNLWLRYKTKNFTKIPLFTMVFDYQKFKENGKDKSCVLYAIHPDIATDEFLKGKLQECVDYIRDNYDMERFTEICFGWRYANRKLLFLQGFDWQHRLPDIFRKADNR